MKGQSLVGSKTTYCLPVVIPSRQLEELRLKLIFLVRTLGRSRFLASYEEFKSDLERLPSRSVIVNYCDAEAWSEFHIKIGQTSFNKDHEWAIWN